MNLERLRKHREDSLDAGLLLLRVGAAALIWTFHMRPKLLHFDHELTTFADPLGVGHAASFTLALLSEGGSSIVVALGLLTRLATLPILFTMAMVLTLAAHGAADADAQSALLFAMPYLVLALTGPGRISLDHHFALRYALFWDRHAARHALR